LAGHLGCQPLLSGDPLRPGESREGYVNFPVPPAKLAAKLVYSPQLMGKQSDSAVVEITLGGSPNRPAAPASRQPVSP
jgi:hypothetical protein